MRIDRNRAPMPAVQVMADDDAPALRVGVRRQRVHDPSGKKPAVHFRRVVRIIIKGNVQVPDLLTAVIDHIAVDRI